MVVKKELHLKHKGGLHARPAGNLVKIASKFESIITIEYNDKQTRVKSMLNIITLGIRENTPFYLIAEGNDAEQALHEMEMYLLGLE